MASPARIRTRSLLENYCVIVRENLLRDNKTELFTSIGTG